MDEQSCATFEMRYGGKRARVVAGELKGKTNVAERTKEESGKERRRVHKVIDKGKGGEDRQH